MLFHILINRVILKCEFCRWPHSSNVFDKHITKEESKNKNRENKGEGSEIANCKILNKTLTNNHKRIEDFD